MPWASLVAVIVPPAITKPAGSLSVPLMLPVTAADAMARLAKRHNAHLPRRSAILASERRFRSFIVQPVVAVQVRNEYFYLILIDLRSDCEIVTSSTVIGCATVVTVQAGARDRSRW